MSKDSTYKFCTDTCNPSSKARLRPVPYFYHNLYLIQLWLLAPAAVFITFSPGGNSSKEEVCLSYRYGLSCVPSPLIHKLKP